MISLQSEQSGIEKRQGESENKSVSDGLISISWLIGTGRHYVVDNLDNPTSFHCKTRSHPEDAAPFKLFNKLTRGKTLYGVWALSPHGLLF